MKKLRGLLIILSLICLLSLGACSLTGGKLTQQKTHNVKIVVEYNKLSFSGLDNETGKYAVNDDMMTKFTTEEAKIYPIISYADLAKLTSYFSTVSDNATKILDRLSKEEETFVVNGEDVEVGSDEFKAIQEFFTERRNTYINYKDNLQKYNIISSQKYLDLKAIPQDSLIFITSENGVESTTFGYKSGNIVDRLIQPVYKTFSFEDNEILVPTDLGERQYINNSSSSPIVYTLVVEEDNSNSLVNFKLNSSCILEEKDSISTDNLLFNGKISSYFVKSQVENEGEDTEKVLTQKFEFIDAVYEEPVINDGDFVFNGFKEYTLETTLELFEEYKEDNRNDLFNEIAQIAIKTTDKDYIDQPYKVKDGFEKQIYVYNDNGEDILVKECYQSENKDNNGKYFEVDENDGFKFVDGTLKEPNEDATAYELSTSDITDYVKTRRVLVPVYRIPDRDASGEASGDPNEFAEIDEATLLAIPKEDVLEIDKNANKVTDKKDLGYTDFKFEAQNMEQVYIKAQLNKILQNELKYDLHGTGEKVEVEIALKTLTYRRGNSKELTYKVPGITNGAFDFGFEVNQSDNEVILSFGLVEVNRQFGVTVSTVGEEKGHVVVSSYAQDGITLEEIIDTSNESSFAQKGVNISELYCIDVFPEENYTFNLKYNNKLFFNCGSLLLTKIDDNQNYAISGTTADSIWYGLNKEEIVVDGKKGIRIWTQGGTADNKLEIEYIHKDDATFSITTELLGEKSYGAILLDPNKTQFKPGELVTVKVNQIKTSSMAGYLKKLTFSSNGSNIDMTSLQGYTKIGENFVSFKMPSYNILVSAEFAMTNSNNAQTINNPYTLSGYDQNNGWIDVVPESVVLKTGTTPAEQRVVCIANPKPGYKLDSLKFYEKLPNGTDTEVPGTIYNSNIISFVPTTNSSTGTIKNIALRIEASFVVDPDYDSNEGNGDGQQGALVVTTPTQANCSVASNLSNANVNDTVTITVTPTSGYNVTGLTIKNSSGQVVTLNVQSIGNNKFTFKMPDYNISVYANVEPAATPVPTYTVSKGTVSGGTISFTNKGYKEGDIVTITGNANTHFTFTGIDFAIASNNSPVSQSTVNYNKNGNTVTFKMPAYNIKVTPVFTEDAKFTITINYLKKSDNSVVATAEKITNYAGTAYSQASPTNISGFDGYDPDKATVSGTITKNETINVYYSLRKVTITVKYQGVNRPDVVATYDYGSTYNIESPSVPGYLPDLKNVSGTATTSKTIPVTYSLVNTGNMVQDLTFVSGATGTINTANFQGPKSTTAIASNSFVQSAEGESLYMVTNTSNQLINASKLYFEVELKVTEKSSDPAPKIGLAVTDTANVNNIYGGNFTGNFVFMDIRDIPTEGAFGANVWCNYTTNNGGWTTFETSPSYQKANATNFNTEFIKYAIYKDGSNFTAYINNQVLFSWTNANLSGNAYVSIMCFKTKFQAQNAKWGDYNPNVSSASATGTLKGEVQSNNIYFETYIDPISLTSDDMFPKTGIYLENAAGNRVLFYVDMLRDGTPVPADIKENNRVGYVAKTGADYSWENENTLTIPGLLTLNKNKYALYKEGSSVTFLINDIVVFTYDNAVFNTNCFVGIDSFNVSYSYQNAKYTTSPSNLPTIKSAYSIGTDLTIDGSLLDWSAEKKANSYGVTASDNSGRGFTAYAFLGTNGIYVAFEILSNTYETTIPKSELHPAWCLNTNVEMRLGVNKVQVYASAYNVASNVRDFAYVNTSSGSLKKTTFELLIPYEVGGYTSSATEVKLGFACRPGSESAPGVCEGNANEWWCGPRHAEHAQSTVKANGIFA